MERRFDGSQEPGTEKHAISAQRQRRSKAASVRDPAGGEHGQRRYGVDPHWHQYQRSHPADMTAGFGSLRHDKVCAGLRGPHRLGDFSRHVHHFRSAVMHAPEIATEVLIPARPGECNQIGARFQRRGKSFLIDSE